MRFLKNFEQYQTEKRIMEHMILFLHEGIKVVQLSNSLNEASNSKNFAQAELEKVISDARKKGDRSLLEEFVPEILALVDKFGNSGQSGGSAPYTAEAITDALKKLLMFQPISPVMNEDDEWYSPIDDMWQNKRCSGVFKEKKDSAPYYIDAIIWKTPNGATYTGGANHNGERILSRQEIKEFPFEPKSFVVDVDEEEVAPDDWVFHVKDPKQLEEVFKYYKKLNPKH